MDEPSKQDGSESPWEFKPGEAVSLSNVTVPSTSPSTAKVSEPQPAPDTPGPSPDHPTQNTPTSAQIPSEPQPESPVLPARGSFAPNIAAPDEAEISWTASEFIVQEKSSSWYLSLGVVSVLAAALAYLVFRDLVTTVVILVAGLALGAYGGVKPREKEYALSQSGLTIGQRYFPYESFRSFSVIDEGAFTSIQFTPLKRFGTPVTIYYHPDDEGTILGLLGERLPAEEIRHDPIDRLMKRIRF